MSSTISSYLNTVSRANVYSSLFSSMGTTSSTSTVSSLYDSYTSSSSSSISSLSSLLNSYYSTSSSKSYYTNSLSATSEAYSQKLSDNASDLQSAIKTLSSSSTYNTDDDKVQINGARELVNSYNAMMKTAKSSSQKIEDKLLSAVDSYSEKLVNAGIYMNENGYLEIDEDKMASAAENGNLKSLFKPSDTTSGFLLRLDFIAQNAETQSTSFIDNSIKTSSSASTSSNSSSHTNAYLAKKYTQLYASNMLLSTFF